MSPVQTLLLLRLCTTTTALMLGCSGTQDEVRDEVRDEVSPASGQSWDWSSVDYYLELEPMLQCLEALKSRPLLSLNLNILNICLIWILSILPWTLSFQVANQACHHLHNSSLPAPTLPYHPHMLKSNLSFVPNHLTDSLYHASPLNTQKTVQNFSSVYLPWGRFSKK